MIKVIQGDITTLAVEAIVNVAKRAVREVGKFLSHAESAENVEEMEVVFCCFSERDRQVYYRSVKQAADLKTINSIIGKGGFL